MSAVTIPDTKLHAWRSFITANARVMARLEAELVEEVDLPLTWYEVLLLLEESEIGKLRMHELAESRLLSRSAATRLIDRMESAGLVRRASCEVDRRGTWVAVTEQGRAKFREAAPIHLRGIAEHFTKHIDDAEAAELSVLTSRILDRLAES